MKQFCPRCGKTTGKFVKGFCLQCFLAENQLLIVPLQLEIEHCRKCRKIKIGGKFVKQNEKLLVEFIKKRIKVKELINPVITIKLKPTANGKAVAFIEAKGKIDSTILTINANTVLIPREIICDNCMKISSYYHEAILQIRAQQKTASKEKKAGILREINQFLSIEAEKNDLAAMIDIIDKKNGFDVLIGSKKAAFRTAKAIAKKYNATIVSSFKTMGTDKKGKEKKRFSYCVKI